MKRNDSLIEYFKKRKKKISFFLGVSFLISILVFLSDSKFTQKEIIAKIKLEGIINDKRDFIDRLENITDNENIKGLLVVVNSPGGTFVSSKEVYDALEKISKNIPTSVYMRELATSGAYLASLGVDKIFANNGTITGSIGVILQTAELTTLLEKVGVRPIIIKSGELKAVPNPLENLEEENLLYMKKIIERLQEEFIELVEKKRNLGIEAKNKIADGRIFTSKQAKALNLIDSVGSESDAIEWIKSEGNLGDEVDILELDSVKSLVDLLKLNVLKKSFNYFNLNLNNGILAIWTPGI